MFGRKKRAELESRFEEYRGKSRVACTEMDTNLRDMTTRNKEVTDKATGIGGRNENIKRNLTYMSALTNDLIEDIREKADIVKSREKYLVRMKDSLRDKQTFDTDKITKTSGKIIDEVRTNERILNSIQEEVRGIEALAARFKDISSQTSALSLNAAIIGAKIDTTDESFVQTATEIKELAADCSKAASELNRKADAIIRLLEDAGKNNSDIRAEAGLGSEAANTFASKYEELYKEFAPKPWEKEDKGVNLDTSVDSLLNIRKSLNEATSTTDDALNDIDGLKGKMEDTAEVIKKAEDTNRRLKEINY
ncbi:MAG: methyl-accepting chemotaxis protein [Lachnospiraceae bacterium]|nr:methyl-accepting chemotaxis protein [Lachnospiraceae bacterium]